MARTEGMKRQDARVRGGVLRPDPILELRGMTPAGACHMLGYLSGELADRGVVGRSSWSKAAAAGRQLEADGTGAVLSSAEAALVDAEAALLKVWGRCGAGTDAADEVHRLYVSVHAALARVRSAEAVSRG